MIFSTNTFSKKLRDQFQFISKSEKDDFTEFSCVKK